MSQSNLFIVDNSAPKSSVKQYLTEWCDISKQMDIATQIVARKTGNSFSTLSGAGVKQLAG